MASSIAAVSPTGGSASWGGRPVIVTGALVLIVMSMVLPMPPGLLDMGIAMSIATATLVLVMASLVDKPADFQAFPLLLLVSLLIRLSLNVSSTRLILTQGHTGTEAAGQIISSFSQFVAGGSLMVGLTVFAVISVVNFMVITKGSGRMAEVSARFALDSLPGKQLAIDGDLNAGSITHEEAKARREQEGREISFFGSLDGASKFVKGDAVAGIVITLINLFIGLAIGVVLHGLPIGEAVATYSYLTIGDGLVTQIPALITSMAAALLLSRGGATDATADMLSTQLVRNWRAPVVVGAGMIILSFVPGMPTFLFLVVAAIAGVIAWQVRRREAEAPDMETTPDLPVEAPAARIGDILDMDEISVEIGAELVHAALDAGRGLGARIENLRIHIARQYGVILPDVRITDSAQLDPGAYVIRIHGVLRGQGVLRNNQVLVLGADEVLDRIGGDPVRDPVYDAKARWIPADRQEEAALSGATAITPMEVLSTHLMEVVRPNLSELLSLSGMQRMLSELRELSDPRRAESYRKLFDSVIPDKITPEMLLTVLRLLLDEGVSIRNLPLIIDAIAEHRGETGAEAICDAVRRRLRGQITQELSQDGTLTLMQLHPAWEAEFIRIESDVARGNGGASLPELARRLTDAVREALARPAGNPGHVPVLAVPDHRRRQVRGILMAGNVQIPVLGLDEIDSAQNLQLLQMVELP